LKFPLVETWGDSWHAVCYGKQRPTTTRSKKAQEKNSEVCSAEPRLAPDRHPHRINTCYSPKESARFSVNPGTKTRALKTVGCGIRYPAENQILRLTLTSHNAKIFHANRQPKGDSRSGRQAHRMERISKRVVQDREKRGLEKLCGGSEQLEKFGCCRALRCFRCKPQSMQADYYDQIQVENGLHPAHS
jgi:hypothetical protein